jgi:Fe-S-cluster-containing dehydrogenase component
MSAASNPWGRKTEITRREFFEKCAEAGANTFVFGAVVCTTAKLLLPPDAEVRSAAGQEPDGNGVVYGFLIDTTKCIGCGSCVRACKAENNVPDGYFRTWVEQYAFYENGEVTVNSAAGGLNGLAEAPKSDRPETTDKPPVRGFFVPKLCNHCINTPCIQVCPVGASYKTKEGVVLVDPKRCIGCGYCVQACPFGSRFLNPETHIADKCTWCYHRITKGLKPACVVACPAKARIFGNVSDPNSEISQLLASNRVQVLKSYLGTNPRTRYIGLDSEVI